MLAKVRSRGAFYALLNGTNFILRNLGTTDYIYLKFKWNKKTSEKKKKTFQVSMKRNKSLVT